jgi:hypothetical protein
MSSSPSRNGEQLHAIEQLLESDGYLTPNKLIASPDLKTL